METLIFKMLGGAALLLGSVHLFRVIVKKVDNFWYGWFWLAPASLGTLGLGVVVEVFFPGEKTFAAGVFALGAGLLVAGIWQWLPPAWWEKIAENSFLKKQIQARREMSDRAMEGLVISHKKLREMELMEERLADRLGRALRIAGTAVVVLDEAGRIKNWQPAAERLFAVGGAAATGRFFEIFLGGKLRGQLWSKVWTRMTDKKIILTGKWFEFTARRGDGREFPAELHLMKISTKTGETEFFVIIRDLSEIFALRAAIENYKKQTREMREKLRERDARIGLIRRRLRPLAKILRTVGIGGTADPPAPDPPSEAAPVMEFSDFLAEAGHATDSPEAENLRGVLAGLAGELFGSGEDSPARPAGGVEVAAGPDGIPVLAPAPIAAPGKAPAPLAPRDDPGDLVSADAEVISFASAGPVQRIFVDVLGKKSQHRQARGLTVLIFAHGKNLTLSVRPSLGKLPARARIPVSCLRWGHGK